MKVAILGCGPAGLFAAQAAANSHKVTEICIFSHKKQSPLFGAQYLHQPIPNLRTESRRLRYSLIGDADTYRNKVYGAGSGVEVSPLQFSGVQDVWDIRLAYQSAWQSFKRNIIDWGIGYEWLSLSLAGKHYMSLAGFDLVVISVPRRIICGIKSMHKFEGTEVWAAGSAPEIGIHYPPDYDGSLIDDHRFPVLPRDRRMDHVICSGRHEDRWYRASRIFDRVTIEWPIARRPMELPGMKPARVIKPLYTDCDCFTNARVRTLFVGRYGKWAKGELSHQAYLDTDKAIAEF